MEQKKKTKIFTISNWLKYSQVRKIRTMKLIYLWLEVYPKEEFDLEMLQATVQRPQNSHVEALHTCSFKLQVELHPYESKQQEQASLISCNNSFLTGDIN